MWRLDRPGLRATVLEVAPPLFRRSVKPMALTTSAIGYVRLHGRNYLQWFSKKADVRARYDYLYSAQELEPWVGRIRTVAEAYRSLSSPSLGGTSGYTEKRQNTRVRAVRRHARRPAGMAGSRAVRRARCLCLPLGESEDARLWTEYFGAAVFAPPGEGRLEWATFQAVRKTNATLSRKAGVDAKVSADQRGHGLGVSLEVYTASDRQQKREAVKKPESAVALKRKPELPEKPEWSDRSNSEMLSGSKLLKNGERDRARTCNPQLRRLMLYPIELRARSGHYRIAYATTGLLNTPTPSTLTTTSSPGRSQRGGL
jgi:hypothetical protein